MKVAKENTMTVEVETDVGVDLELTARRYHADGSYSPDEDWYLDEFSDAAACTARVAEMIAEGCWHELVVFDYVALQQVVIIPERS